MSEKIEVKELYSALDNAIGGFEARMIEAAEKVILREKAVIEAKILEKGTVFEAQLSTLTRQIDDLRKAMPGATPAKPQQPTTLRLAAPLKRPATNPFPPLPRPLTVGSLAEYVSRQGFKVANNRSLDGGLWVYQDQISFGALAKYIEDSGINVKYYHNGRRKRPGPQYLLDVPKLLPP
jgi:hypothetical protein